MGVSQDWGTFLGVHIIRTIVYLGLYWDPPFSSGNYHIGNILPYSLLTTNKLCCVWESSHVLLGVEN